MKRKSGKPLPVVPSKSAGRGRPRMFPEAAQKVFTLRLPEDVVVDIRRFGLGDAIRQAIIRTVQRVRASRDGNDETIQKPTTSPKKKGTKNR